MNEAAGRGASGQGAWLRDRSGPTARKESIRITAQAESRIARPLGKPIGFRHSLYIQRFPKSQPENSVEREMQITKGLAITILWNKAYNTFACQDFLNPKTYLCPTLVVQNFD
jgi:hypothetical protein